MAVAAMVLFAGKGNAQITLHAGWQNAKYSIDYGSESTNVNLGGFYAGATYDYDLGMASIYVTPGAEISYCSDKVNDIDLSQMDLRIRLWGRWNKNLNEEIVFGLFAGPSINIGLSGTAYDKDKGGLNKFDLGLTFGAQLVYNKIGIEGGYNLGLLNRLDGGSDDESIKFHTLFLGVNYIL